MKVQLKEVAKDAATFTSALSLSMGNDCTTPYLQRAWKSTELLDRDTHYR